MNLSEVLMTLNLQCRSRAKSGSSHLLCVLLVVVSAAGFLMSPPLAAAAPSFEFEASWDYSDPAATEATFRAFLDATSEPANSEYVLQLQTQIARTLGLQGEFDRANSLLDTVQKGLSESSPVAQVRHLLERGRTLNSSGQAEAARPLFEKAWLSAQELGEDFHAVDAAHMVAIVADGDDGLLVDPWDPAALRAAIQQLLANPTRAGEMGRAGRDKVETLFNRRRYYDELCGVYAKATESAGQRA